MSEASRLADDIIMCRNREAREGRYTGGQSVTTGGALLTIIIAIWVLIVSLVSAAAHDIPGFSPEMQAWASNAPITERGKVWLQAKHNSYWTKCCDHAEIVDARFIVEPDGSDGWRWNDKGTIRTIPPEIIHPHGDHAPNGKATLFIYQGVPTCFFLPLSGI